MNTTPRSTAPSMPTSTASNLWTAEDLAIAMTIDARGSYRLCDIADAELMSFRTTSRKEDREELEVLGLL